MVERTACTLLVRYYYGTRRKVRVGVYAQVWSFRCQAVVDKTLRKEAGPLLANVHAFYRLHVPAVQAAVAAGLAPIEKQLQVRPRCLHLTVFLPRGAIGGRWFCSLAGLWNNPISFLNRMRNGMEIGT